MSLDKAFVQFFQGPRGQKSSKRLIAIASGTALVYLAIRGGEHFLKTQNHEAFLELFEYFGIFVASVTGFSLADHKFKKDNEKISNSG